MKADELHTALLELRAACRGAETLAQRLLPEMEHAPRAVLEAVLVALNHVTWARGAASAALSALASPDEHADDPADPGDMLLL